MIALKTLLTIVGVLLMTAAAGIPLHGLWMQFRHAMRKRPVGDGLLLGSSDIEPEPEPDPIAWRVPVALGYPDQPDEWNGARNAVPWPAFCNSPGGERADV